MLTAYGWSMFPVREYIIWLLGIILVVYPVSAFAQNVPIPVVEVRKAPPVRVLFAPPGDGYSYRQTNHDKTISIMLYGFRDQPVSNPILKDRKALSAFFKQHLDRIRDDYFSKDPTRTRLVTGEVDFNSAEINRGPRLEPAKMAGLTVPFGNRMTFGGGYSWGEKNPALMRLTKADGLFTGVSYYSKGGTGYQLSFLSSGQKLGGLKISGTKVRYDSLMLGTSFRVNERLGLTATLQYRRDKDPLTTGDQQVIVTIGTKWKF